MRRFRTSQTTQTTNAIVNSVAWPRSDRREDLLIADLAEPEPVGVEARRATAPPEEAAREHDEDDEREADGRTSASTVEPQCDALVQRRWRFEIGADIAPRALPARRTRANGPQPRIQLRSAQSWQTSSDSTTPPSASSRELLRRMPDARADVRRDALRRTRSRRAPAGRCSRRASWRTRRLAIALLSA